MNKRYLGLKQLQKNYFGTDFIFIHCLKIAMRKTSLIPKCNVKIAT